MFFGLLRRVFALKNIKHQGAASESNEVRSLEMLSGKKSLDQ